MPISYVRFVGQRPVTLIRREGGVGGWRVLVFDPVLEEQRSLSLGDRFRLVDIGLRDADALIFRASTLWTIQEERDFVQLVQQDPIIADQGTGRLIGVFGVEGLDTQSPRMEWRLHARGSALALPDIDWLSVVRETEIKAFLSRTEAERYDPSIHYALPTGVHADRFISIGRLLSDAVNVERVADWFIDALPETGAILLDQAPMLPLGIVLQSLTQRAFGWTPAVRVLEDYPADLKTFNDALVSLSDDPLAARQVLFLLSVSCTGGLARMFRAVAPGGSRIRILISGSEDKKDVAAAPLCEIPITRLQVSRHGRCDLCRGQVELHRLDSRTYEDSVILPGRKVKATQKLIRPRARFWGIADEADAVRIHHDDLQNQRHHAVYLEIPPLLAHPEFRRQCLRKLGHVPKPDVVIIPGHASSQVVADLVRESFDGIWILPLSEGSNRIPEAVRPRLASQNHILVADDAVITTKTIVDLKFQIYDLCNEFRRDPTLNVFVVLARPSDSQVLRGLTNTLRDHLPGSHLHFGWQVFLPQPGKGNCPFCLEHDLLERSLHELSPEAREEAQQRIEALRGTLRDPLRGPVEGRRIGGSFFVKKRKREARDALPRSVFGAVQGAAMDVLDQAASKGESENRSYRVNDRDLLDKFFDSEILGGFFRTFARKVLSWPANDEEMVAKLATLTPTEASLEVVAEIGWAAAIGRLPARAVLSLLDEAEEHPRVGLLRELIHLNNLGEPLLESPSLARRKA